MVKPYVFGQKARTMGVGSPSGDKPKSLMDQLPDWVGYGMLYGVSVIPLAMAAGVVIIVFWNSLK